MWLQRETRLMHRKEGIAVTLQVAAEAIDRVGEPSKTTVYTVARIGHFAKMSAQWHGGLNIKGLLALTGGDSTIGRN